MAQPFPLLFLYARQIKIGNIGGFGGGGVLGKAVQAEGFHVQGGVPGLRGAEVAVDLGILVRLSQGDILTHEGEQDLSTWELLGHPVHDPSGLIETAGEEQVADDDSAAEQTVRTEYRRTHLAEHFQDRSLGDLWIVLRSGVTPGAVGGEIFQIGQIDAYLALQGAQGIHAVVAS